MSIGCHALMVFAACRSRHSRQLRRTQRRECRRPVLRPSNRTTNHKNVVRYERERPQRVPAAAFFVTAWIVSTLSGSDRVRTLALLVRPVATAFDTDSATLANS